jgi:F0F1-type ATP synthase assembly protein I
MKIGTVSPNYLVLPVIFPRNSSNRREMDNSPDDRSSYADAMQWVSRITSVVTEMVLPGVIGYWIDLRLGTQVVFLILGVILGFVGGIWQLIKMTKHKNGA